MSKLTINLETPLRVSFCHRCAAPNKIMPCVMCGYPYGTEPGISRKEYCEIFGHVMHSSSVLKTIEEGCAIKEVCKCAGCGQEFKRDPPTEPIGRGNCKKENHRSDDGHDDYLKY